MKLREIIFLSYAIFGFLIVLFNSVITNFNYNLSLYLTDRLNWSRIFIFKINKKNKDSMRFLMRSFVILFGLSIFFLSLYYLYH